MGLVFRFISEIQSDFALNMWGKIDFYFQVNNI